MRELSRFIVKENSIHHRIQFYSDESFIEEIDYVCEEDIALFDSSVYYAAISNKKFVGSVKITLWDKLTVLPLQKLFDINWESIPLMNADTLIWHVGRLAVSKNDNPQGTALLKKLLTLAIYSICKHPNSIMLAECDRKLLRGLNLMGIKTKALATSIDYLGSETVPVYATREWLNAFLMANDYVKTIARIYDETVVPQL